MPFNIALVGLIALVLCLTLLEGWKRDVLLVPTIWLAGIRLGDASRARSVRPDAVAPPRRDPHHPHDGASAGAARKTTRGGRLMDRSRSSSSRNVSKAFGGLQCIVDLDLEVRRGRDTQRHRAERGREDDVVQPHHRHLRAGCGRHPPRRREPRRARAAQDHQPRRCAHVPDLASVPEHERQGERDGGDVRSNPGVAGRVDAASSARSARGARVERSRRGEARLLRRAADGLPLEPACLQPLVRQPATTRDRPRDRDEAAHPPPRRACRRHEPRRDARDHRADQQAAGTRVATRSS